jgi:hypothetical protein
MSEEVPFQLVLETLTPLGLQTRLVNGSSTAQKYCYDSFWQSCDLVLTTKAGEVVHAYDRRTIMMPSTPISQYAFGRLGPGETEILQSGQFEKLEKTGYQLRWGHTTFQELPPGTYCIVAQMECQRDSWADKDRKWYTEDDIWKGSLTSERIKINLP